MKNRRPKMETRINFSEILRKDGKIRLLLGGMVVDGALILSLFIMTGVLFTL